MDLSSCLQQDLYILYFIPCPASETHQHPCEPSLAHTLPALLLNQVPQWWCRHKSHPQRISVLPSLLNEGKIYSLLLCCEEHRKDSACLDTLINQIWFSSLALAPSCALVHDQALHQRRLMFSLPSCRAGESNARGSGKPLLSDLVLNCAPQARFAKAG